MRYEHDELHLSIQGMCRRRRTISGHLPLRRASEPQIRINVVNASQKGSRAYPKKGWGHGWRQECEPCVYSALLKNAASFPTITKGAL